MTGRTSRPRHRPAYWIASVLLLSGCAGLAVNQFDTLYGKSKPRDRVVEALPPGQVDYWQDVKPVIEGRCVVCHGCYDAACQLKMSSIEGILRGGSSDRVYDQSRLTPAPPTRLFDDAQSLEQWRSMNFHPVLNEYPDSAEANRQASVLYRMLDLKQRNPLPDEALLPDSFTLGLGREEACTTAEAFDSYAADNPLWGMPYALPGLEDRERELVMRWVEQGANYTARPDLPPEFIEQIESWEAFFNGDSLKQKLASRYIYEHLSYAHFYFPALSEQHFFNLVRSATPPGQDIEVLATRRPFDDPGAERIYYRLRPVVGSIVQKTHMPYALDSNRMKRWQSLFIDPDYEVSALPVYDPAIASNPFRAFHSIPVESRYKFMLDEAHFTISAFIKGPVCRGEVAVDVINDRFWVFFTEPGRAQEQKLEKLLAESGKRLDLPASDGTIYRPIKRWLDYKDQQGAFLHRKDRFMLDALAGGATITLDNIWDGEGVNRNAALTVFRHHDSATVEKGLLGAPPKTAWVIDYSLLERIHYLLVAGYDVYGNLGHQLDTRLYMDFLRMEGESNFLLFLPRDARNRIRNFWYRDVDDAVKAFVSSPGIESKAEPSIAYGEGDAKQQLFKLLKERLAPVLASPHQFSPGYHEGFETQLDALNRLQGTPVNLLPEVTLLRIASDSSSAYFTLLRNTAYANMTSLFLSSDNRLPAEDTLTVLPGFIGSYPNALMSVKERDVDDFANRLASLETEADYHSLMSRYGIRRTNPEFWRFSDTLHEGLQRADPLQYGVLDYNRLENR